MYSVILSKKAKAQIKDIVLYISQDSQDRAEKYIRNSFASFKNIVSQFPKAGVKEIDDIYSYIYKKNLLFLYKIKEEEKQVAVFRVVNTKDYKSYFKYRKLNKSI